MSLLELARHRYSTRAYDATYRIPDAQIDTLLELVRLTASSLNIQPWHFFVASDIAGKTRIRPGVQGNFASNDSKVMDASHVIVLCTRTAVDEAHQEALRAQEAQDGRYHTEKAKQATLGIRAHNLAAHQQKGDTQTWLEKQTYIALGSLLLGAAELGLDATPIEGFDHALLDEALNLPGQGLSSTLIVTLGKHSEADGNAKLPKSRLARDYVVTHLSSNT